jgi:hypothetical protein
MLLFYDIEKQLSQVNNQAYSSLIALYSTTFRIQLAAVLSLDQGLYHYHERSDWPVIGVSFIEKTTLPLTKRVLAHKVKRENLA